MFFFCSNPLGGMQLSPWQLSTLLSSSPGFELVAYQCALLSCEVPVALLGAKQRTQNVRVLITKPLLRNKQCCPVPNHPWAHTMCAFYSGPLGPTSQGGVTNPESWGPSTVGHVTSREYVWAMSMGTSAAMCRAHYAFTWALTGVSRICCVHRAVTMLQVCNVLVGLLMLRIYTVTRDSHHKLVSITLPVPLCDLLIYSQKTCKNAKWNSCIFHAIHLRYGTCYVIDFNISVWRCT